MINRTDMMMWRTTVREVGTQTTLRMMRVNRWRAKSSGNSLQTMVITIICFLT